MSSSSNVHNLQIRFQELNVATSRDAAIFAARGKRATVWRLLFSPFGAFLQSYIGQKKWRNGIAGLVDAMFAAYEVFVRYAKLWEIHHTTETIPPPHT
ncbi:MAG: hypothetical protein AB7P69_13290 [Candidatus Binatia bacterium]